MRVLLRDLESGAFFTRHGGWTQRLEEALDFEQQDLATRVASELGLKNAELVMAVGDGGSLFGVRLPGNDSGKRGPKVP